MMMGKPEQERVRTLLCEAVAMLCKSSIIYKSHFTLQGLLGITVDEEQIILVELKETVKNPSPEPVTNSDTNADSDTPSKCSSSKKRKKGRRRSESPINQLSPDSHSDTLSEPPSKKQTITIPDDDDIVCVKQERFATDDAPESDELTFDQSGSLGQSTALPHLSSISQPLEDFPGLAGSDLSVPGCSKWEGGAEGSEDNMVLPSIPVTKYGIFGTLPIPLRPRGMLPMYPPFGNSSPSHPAFGSHSPSHPAFGSRSPSNLALGSRSPLPNIRVPYRTVSPSVRTSSSSGSTHRPSPGKSRIQQTLMLMQGCVVTARMLCRKKGLLINDVLDAMSSMSLPTSHPAYCGMYIHVSNHMHLFYKCPPDTITDAALSHYNVKRASYTVKYYENPRPARGGPVNWPMYVEMLLLNSPYPKEDFPLEKMGLNDIELAALQKCKEKAILKNDSRTISAAVAATVKTETEQEPSHRKTPTRMEVDQVGSYCSQSSPLHALSEAVRSAGFNSHLQKSLDYSQQATSSSGEEDNVEDGEAWNDRDLDQLGPESMVDHTETVGTSDHINPSTEDNFDATRDDDSNQDS